MGRFVRTEYFTVEVALLLLAVAFCLQQVALADVDPVLVVEEEDLNTDGLSTSRRFLTESSHHHHKSKSHISTSCKHNFQVCTRRTVHGHKKYKNPGCCNGCCVDFKDDRDNCGSCGRKCGYGAVCCKGQCKHIYGSDCANCGGCGKKCGKGVKCMYGICGYNSGSHEHSGHSSSSHEHGGHSSSRHEHSGHSSRSHEHTGQSHNPHQGNSGKSNRH